MGLTEMQFARQMAIAKGIDAQPPEDVALNDFIRQFRETQEVLDAANKAQEQADNAMRVMEQQAQAWLKRLSTGGAIAVESDGFALFWMDDYGVIGLTLRKAAEEPDLFDPLGR